MPALYLLFVVPRQPSWPTMRAVCPHWFPRMGLSRRWLRDRGHGGLRHARSNRHRILLPRSAAGDSGAHPPHRLPGHAAAAGPGGDGLLALAYDSAQSRGPTLAAGAGGIDSRQRGQGGLHAACTTTKATTKGTEVINPSFPPLPAPAPKQGSAKQRNWGQSRLSSCHLLASRENARSLVGFTFQIAG